MTDAVIHPTAVVDEGAEIGGGTRVWHFSHIMPGVRIGGNCILGQNVYIDRNVTIGDGVKIQNNVSVYTGVTLEDYVFLGPSCVFTNVFNPRAHIERKDEFLPTLVKRGAMIGANSTVVCGSTIGEYALVGAGSVVTRDVTPHRVVFGNPARARGWACACGEVLKGGPEYSCARCGSIYFEEGEVLKPR